MSNAYTVTKTINDGQLLFYDNSGAGGANILDEDSALQIGDLSITLPKFVMDKITGDLVGADVVDIKRRNRFVQSRRGEEQPAEGTFTCHLANFTGDATIDNASILDLAMWKSGGATAVDSWVPTNGASAEVAQFGLRFRMEGTSHGESKDHDLVFTKVQVKVDSITEAADGNTVSCSFRAWGLTKA